MVARNKLWWILTGINLTVVIIAFMIEQKLAIRLAVWIGLFFLCLTLMPVRLMRWIKMPVLILAKFVANRRQFGITAGLMFSTHAMIAIYKYNGLNTFFFLSPEIIPALIADAINIVMLVTSLQYLNNKLGKYWKLLHRLIWFAVPVAFFHSLMAANSYSGHTDLLSFLVFGSLLAFVLLDVIVLKLLKRLPTSVPWLTLGITAAGVVTGLLLYLS